MKSISPVQAVVVGILLGVLLVSCGEDPRPPRELESGASSHSARGKSETSNSRPEESVTGTEEGAAQDRGEGPEIPDSSPEATEPDSAEADEKLPGSKSEEDTASVVEEEPETQHHRLRVVDEEGRPREGAEVFLWDWEAGGTELLSLPSKPNGGPRKTDEKGEVTIPGLTVGNHRIIARSGADLAAGWARVAAPEAGSGEEEKDGDETPASRRKLPELRLETCRRLEVEVKDDRGEALRDALLVLINPASQERAHAWSSEFDGHRLPWVRTGESGRAIVYLRPRGGSSLFRAKKLKVIQLRYGDDFPEAQFDRVEERISMTVPPTVAMTFAVKDQDGRALERDASLFWTAGTRDPVGVELNLQDDSEAMRNDVLGRYFWNWMTSLPSGQGRICAFAPGAKINTSVRSPEHCAATKLITLGSEREQSADLATGRKMCRLQVRIVDKKGLVFDDLAVFYELTTSGRTEYLSFVPAEKKGYRQCWIDPSWTGILVVKSGRNFGGRFMQRGNETLARVKLTKLESGGFLDLGDIAAKRQPVLVAGVVKDKDGVVVPGVYINYREMPDKDDFDFEAFRFFSDVTDESGRFEIRGKKKEGVKASIGASGEWFCDQKDCKPGSLALELVVERGGGIGGNLELAKPELLKDVAVSYQMKGQDGRGGRISLDSNGRLRALHLPAGIYDVVVTIAGIETQRIKDIEVQAGKIARPASLKSLSVGSDFEVVSVTVKGPGGYVVPKARVRLESELTRSGNWGRRLTTDKEGRVAFVVKKGEALKIVATSEERQGPDLDALVPTEVQTSSFPVTINMKAAALLSVEFSESFPDHPDGNWLVCLSRERSAFEMKKLVAAAEQRAKRSGRPLPTKPELPSRIEGGAEKLPPGGVDVSFEVREASVWEIVLRRPGRHDAKEFVVLGKVAIKLDGDVEHEIEVSEATMAAVEKFIER